MFFFNSTATPEIYSFRHTLSLPDALPICYGINAPEKKWNDYAGVNVKGKIVLILVNDPDYQTPTLRGPFNGRSEEHTSELQSLIRISYAVFCSKKKKHKTNNYPDLRVNE